MDKIVRRYIVPLGILIIGSFLINFLTRVLPSVIFGNVYYLLLVLMLFAFGMSLNIQKTKLKNFSLRHILIVIFVILLYLFDTKIINVPLYNWFLSYTTSDLLITKIMYVYFGWLFNER